MPDFNSAAIPAALGSRPQWLIWRSEQKPGDKKARKVPYYASGKRRTGEQGSEADRAALVTLATALEALERQQATGIGFAFLPGDGLIGIDLDKMVDPETGEIASRAKQIIEACASYTEWSPSGTGFHIYVEGTTATAKDNGIGVEMFCGRQFFTVTGRHLAETPREVAPIPAPVLRRLHKTIAAAKGGFAEAPPAPASPPAAAGAPSRHLTEAEKARAALAALDAGVGYDDWIRIGMALSSLGQEGFSLWCEWSARSEKFPGEQALAGHWRSFKGGGVKLGTLYKLARDAGWAPPRAPRQPRDRRGAFPPGAMEGADSETSSPPPGARAGGGGDGEGKPPWIPHLVWGRDGLKACLSNVFQVLLHHPAWAGVVAYDEFALCLQKRQPPPYAHGTTGEWDAQDDSRTAMWLARLNPEWKFTPSSDLVAEAVEVLGRANAFHPVREWLQSSPWDGNARLDSWLHQYLGVADTEYTRLVGRWWLMGAVARIVAPGRKFDYCLVLEGRQGKGKSQALSILGGEWFGDTDLDLAHKDAMSALRGKLIYEIAELGGLMKAEERKQKSFLSRQVDEYRPVYGRREIKAPRQVVFAGTTNEFEWLKDPTGGRRFWPVECGEIDLEGLRSVRDQLFAEAYFCILADERFWPTAEQQRLHFDPEQLKVEQQDSLVDALHDWVFGMTRAFSMAEAAMDGLKMDASKLTRDVQTRLGTALRKLGCTKVEKKNGMTRFWYEPPAREEAQQTSRPAQPGGGEARDPF